MERREFQVKIPLPQNWLTDFCVLDIECIKVSAPVGWPQRTRFKTIMAGIGYWSDAATFNGTIMAGDDERELIEQIDDALGLSAVCCYAATRDFDRMVLEARWINARRAHAAVPGSWPRLDYVDDEAGWLNVRPLIRGMESTVDRTSDIASVEVLRRWPLGDREPVWNHNRLDLMDLAGKLSLKFSVK